MGCFRVNLLSPIVCIYYWINWPWSLFRQTVSLTPMAQTYLSVLLTHWGRVTHICASEIIIIGSDNGLSPGRRQAIIWTNAGILLIGPMGINFNEILIEINTFSFNKMHLKMSSAKWRLFRLGLNVLNTDRGIGTRTCGWTICFLLITCGLVRILTGNVRLYIIYI